MKKYLTEEQRIERMERKLKDNADIFVKALSEGKRISLIPGRSSFRVFICEEVETDINGRYNNGIGGGRIE